MDTERRAWFKYRALAYLFIVAIAVYGAWRAETALNVVAKESARVSIKACQAVGEDRVVILSLARDLVNSGSQDPESLELIEGTLERPPNCVEQEVPNVNGHWHIHDDDDPVLRWHFHFED